MLKKLNHVVLFLTTNDIFVWGAYLIASPLQGIFLAQRFGGQSITYVAVGISLYYFARSLSQLPIGLFVDRRKRDNDEIIILMLGSVLIGMSFIFFPFVTAAWHYYLLMLLAGVGASCNLNTWRKLFARNLSKDREGREYAIYETLMSFFTAIFSLIGGEFNSFGGNNFTNFFIIIGIIIVLGGFSTVLLFKVQRKS